MKMKFKVIYDQVVTEKAMFVVEAESERALVKCFGEIERRANSGFIDSFHDVFHTMDGSEDISVLEYSEDYGLSVDAPEYYDHWEIHDSDELEKEND